jgi:hypothetical protein
VEAAGALPSALAAEARPSASGAAVRLPASVFPPPRKGAAHRLAASGNYRAPSFHVGPESDITNFKKIKKMRNLRMASFYVT